MSKKIYGIPVTTPLNPGKIAEQAAAKVTPEIIGARPDTWMPSASDVGAAPSSHTTDKNNPHGVTAAQAGAVPTSRTVNGKALSSNITLSASDVGAAPSGYGLGKSKKITWDTINKQEPGWYYIAGEENTICGHTASYWYMHVSSYSDGTAHCTQTLYSVNGDHTFVRRQNNGTWSEWVDVSPSGLVRTSRKVNDKALSADITLSAADVGAVPIKREERDVDAAGWYSIAQAYGMGSGAEVLAVVSNVYNNNSPSGLVIAASLQKDIPSITVLNAPDKSTFTKARIVYNASENKMKLEVYYARSKYNGCSVSLYTGYVGYQPKALNFEASTATDEDVLLTHDIKVIPSGNVMTDHRTFLYRRKLTAADNLDNFLEDGVFVYETNKAPTNAPFPNASVGICFGSDSATNQRIQLVMRYGATGYMAFRGYTSGWTPWSYVYTDVYNALDAAYQRGVDSV